MVTLLWTIFCSQESLWRSSCFLTHSENDKRAGCWRRIKYPLLISLYWRWNESWISPLNSLFASRIFCNVAWCFTSTAKSQRRAGEHLMSGSSSVNTLVRKFQMMALSSRSFPDVYMPLSRPRLPRCSCKWTLPGHDEFYGIITFGIWRPRYMMAGSQGKEVVRSVLMMLTLFRYKVGACARWRFSIVIDLVAKIR